MNYIVKYHHPFDEANDTYLTDPGDSEAYAHFRSDAYRFATAVEAAAEAERLNRDLNPNHIVLPVLKKRNP